MSGFTKPTEEGRSVFGIDRLLLRLTVFGTIIVTIFVALFSRLWFLQVLEASEFRQLAKQNRTRLVESDPPR